MDQGRSVGWKSVNLGKSLFFVVCCAILLAAATPLTRAFGIPGLATATIGAFVSYARICLLGQDFIAGSWRAFYPAESAAFWPGFPCRTEPACASGGTDGGLWKRAVRADESFRRAGSVAFTRNVRLPRLQGGASFSRLPITASGSGLRSLEGAVDYCRHVCRGACGWRHDVGSRSPGSRSWLNSLWHSGVDDAGPRCANRNSCRVELRPMDTRREGVSRPMADRQ